MTIQLPKRTRESMLQEWDEEFSQEDREAVAHRLFPMRRALSEMFIEANGQGWEAQAREIERLTRLIKLAMAILAFDPDKDDP